MLLVGNVFKFWGDVVFFKCIFLFRCLGKKEDGKIDLEMGIVGLRVCI